ncbi:MAG TPA: helix-turn-helix domain-containing protein [Patescibacteria group bacterium]|nr:helix-turn-helix domain-containing protein [Patescibacteria group bacterium]
MKDEAILRALQNVGLDQKESAVYTALLELGQGTVFEIAKRAELKRAIVYHVVERLKEKGYVHDVVAGKVKRFGAVDPSKIFQHTRAAVEDLKFMLPLLHALQNKGRSKPRMEYFEGREAILATYHVYEQSQDTRYVTSFSRMNELFPRELEAWFARVESGSVPTRAKHLITDTRIDREWAKNMAKHDQDIRFLPKGARMAMDFAITQDLIGITSFDPLFVVVIHNKGIAESASQLFDLAWEQGKEK